MRPNAADPSATSRTNRVRFTLGVLLGFLLGRFVYSDSEPSATEAVARAMLRHSQNNVASLKREQESRKHADQTPQ